MKKFNILLLLCLSASLLHAQHQINSFFEEEYGSVRMETQELQGDKIVSVFHRSEDIVWHRTVYSIIDLRYKQNYELYFPCSDYYSEEKSLFGVVLEAVTGGARAYRRMMYKITPTIGDTTYLQTKEKISISNACKVKPSVYDSAKNSVVFPDSLEGTPLFVYDSAKNELSVEKQAGVYAEFVENQFKFLIQEVIFFDKHYSRLYRQIVAIAPMYAPLCPEGVDDPYEAIINEIMFWMPFKDLRHYLKLHYVKSSRNSSKRITFDRFFQQRLYTSYIVGEENVYDRVIPEYVKTAEQIKKEQTRIENELLTFEQDLWEN